MTDHKLRQQSNTENFKTLESTLAQLL